MARSVGNFEDPLLRQERFHFVPGDDISLLQSFDGKIFTGVFILGQNYFAKVSTTQNRKKPEIIQHHARHLRLPSRFVNAVPELQWPRNVVHHLLATANFSLCNKCILPSLRTNVESKLTLAYEYRSCRMDDANENTD